MHTLLVVIAHPDDETICSGLMAMAVARGWRVTVACATRGEAGEISDPALATPQTLGQVREAELRCACGRLGVDDVRLLGYCDSGMAGTQIIDLPTSFHRAAPETVIDQIAALLTELRPNIVITFEPNGIYGHPDHIAISRYTTAAFDRIAAANGQENASPRLLYAGVPFSWLAETAARLQAAGLVVAELEGLDQGQDDAFAQTITHRLEVGGFVQAKAASLACHRTQLKPYSFFSYWLDTTWGEMLTPEFYAQVRPNPGIDAGLLDQD